jgi:hypothetical protein
MSKPTRSGKKNAVASPAPPVVQFDEASALAERYRESLPDDIVVIIDQSLVAADQSVLAREIAVCDVAIRHTLAAYVSGLPFSPAERKELATATNLLQRGISDRDSRKRDESLARLRKLADGEGDKRGWGEELRQWLDMRRRLVETEEKRSKLANESVPRQQHYAELSLLMALLNREIEDKKALRRVVEEFLKATGRVSAAASLPAKLG